MKRAGGVTIALLGLAVTAGGCGSSDSGTPNVASIQSVPTTATPAPAAQPEQASKPAAKPAPRRKKPHITSQTSLKNASRQAVESLPDDKRIRVVDQAAGVVFAQLGFGSPDVTVTEGGKFVRAVVATKHACGGRKGSAGRIASRIREVAPFVQTVQVTVAGASGSLSDYIGRNCPALTLPSGKGRVVLTHEGTNFTTTRAFTVRSKRWTVEYVNGGSFLQVLTMRGDQPTGGAVSAVKKGSGRQVMTGAGRFRLKVSGTDWTIRVRDGA